MWTRCRRRWHDFRLQAPEKLTKEPEADWLKRMKKRMALEKIRERYRLRKHMVEPVFGVVKEEAMRGECDGVPVFSLRSGKGGGKVGLGDARLQLQAIEQH